MKYSIVPGGTTLHTLNLPKVSVLEYSIGWPPYSVLRGGYCNTRKFSFFVLLFVFSSLPYAKYKAASTKYFSLSLHGV